MKIACPNCTQRFDVPEDWIGREIECATCKETLVISEPPPPPAEPPAAEPPPPVVTPAAPPVEAPLPAAPPPRHDPALTRSVVPPRNDPILTRSVVPPAAAAPTVRPTAPPPAAPLRAPAAYSPYGTPARPPRPRGLRDLVALLGVLLVVGAGLFGYVSFRNQESPQQTWQRFSALLAGPGAPAPIPAAVQGPSAPPDAGPNFAPVTTVAPTPKRSLLGPETVAPARPVAQATPAPVFGLPSVAVPEPQTTVSAAPPTPVLVPAIPEAESRSPASLFGSTSTPPPDPGTPQSAAKPAPPVAEEPTRPAKTASGPFPATAAKMAMNVDADTHASDPVSNRRVTLSKTGTLRLSAPGDPLPGSVVNFTSPDAWLVLDKVPAAAVLADLFDRFWVNGAPADLGVNVRVVQYGPGSAVIPHAPDYAGLQAYSVSGFGGLPSGLRCGVKYDAAGLQAAGVGAVGSFRLKRGYMATLAQAEDGTGISKNYVAQDADLEVRQLPAEFGGQVKFVRVFPWRWTSKKGVSGGIWQNLNVGWFYDWNIGHKSTPTLEYVPIRQNGGWPGLRNQDWIARGSTHLLGYNEPDHKDQSNLTVDAALAGWPNLLATGLRLGSPAVSDGGLGWLYEFMEKADAAKLRVDFVAVHYYRAVANPADARGAAGQMYSFLKGIHDRTHRPIWVTEWNNGANWTGHKPTYEQETAAIRAMVDMLDRAPFVERYAIYNWVQDERNVQRKDGTLTEAGKVYRDNVAPPSYVQAKY